MDALNHLLVERNRLEGELLSIEQSINELVPESAEAEREVGHLATSLRRHFAQLRAINALLSERSRDAP
jgi:chromosome segregation ATPase